MKIKEVLLHRKLPFLLAALALVLGLPFLGTGLLVDDYFHRAAFLEPDDLDGLFNAPFTAMFRFADGDPERTGELVSRGMCPWYSLDTLRLHFWRPLTVATHWVDYALWPDAPWLMHLHSLLWFAAAVAAVAMLYRRMMGPVLAAGIAALLFTIDDAHALPAGWIANRNGLIALFWGCTALSLHDRWRRGGAAWASPLAVASLGLGLLAAEGAVAVCAYLFSYALFLEKGPRLRRLATLAPYAAVVIVWRAFYQWAGYGAGGSSAYLDPLNAPGAFLRALFSRGPVLFLGQWGFPPSDFYTFSPPPAKPFFVVWAVLCMMALLPFFIPLLRKDPVARFWAFASALAIIPICSTGPMDRLLVFPSIGAMGLLAQFFLAVRRGELNLSPGLRKRLLRPIYGLMVSIHFVLAPLLFVGMMFLFVFGNGIIIGIVENAIPKTEDIRGKTVLLAGTSHYPIGLYLFLHRALRGEPAPAALRSLAPDGMAPVPLAIERVSESELHVSPQGGYGPSVFRGESPLQAGDRVELGCLTVEVLDTGPEGWPASAAFRFDRTLEDPSLLWLEIRGVEAVPWTPPGVGESATLNEF